MSLLFVCNRRHIVILRQAGSRGINEVLFRKTLQLVSCVDIDIHAGSAGSMTTILRQLHWLPIKRRIEYTILVLVHKALYEDKPEYLAARLHQYAPRRCLRSGSGLLPDVPRVNLERFGRRTLACAGPTLWNKLPTYVETASTHYLRS